jgi:hypothetical protein
MRDQMIERRRPVMQSWANYVCNETEAGTARLLPFKGKSR